MPDSSMPVFHFESPAPPKLDLFGKLIAAKVMAAELRGGIVVGRSRHLAGNHIFKFVLSI